LRTRSRSEIRSRSVILRCLKTGAKEECIEKFEIGSSSVLFGMFEPGAAE